MRLFEPKPASVIGNTTDKSIKAGISFGYIGLVEGIIERMRGILGEKSKVLATGGAAEIVAENSGEIDVVNENCCSKNCASFTKNASDKFCNCNRRLNR